MTQLPQDRIQTIFRKVFDQDDLVVHPQLTAADVEDWDSMTHIRLIVAIEKEFKIKFQASEILKLKNVGDMLKLIETRLQA